jgi:hypothetical protein
MGSAYVPYLGVGISGVLPKNMVLQRALKPRTPYMRNRADLCNAGILRVSLGEHGIGGKFYRINLSRGSQRTVWSRRRTGQQAEPQRLGDYPQRRRLYDARHRGEQSSL